MTSTAPWFPELCAVMGDAVVLDDDVIAPHLQESRGRFVGQCAAFVQPKTVEAVQDLMRFCHEHSISVVPQGGNTGHVGGAVGQADSVLLSLSKLNSIRSIDPLGGVMTVDAGCILQTVQTAAADHGLMFPLSLASQGSCQIGGTLATNAGGVHVIKYGSMRDLVLGLEIVLADGSKIEALRALPKDNTGYALKHLFIGSEGTLGIITGAVLKLFQQPSARETVFFACQTLDQLMDVFQQFRRDFGDGVEAFEMMPRFGVELSCRHTVGAQDPFDQAYEWYGLVDVVAFGQGEAGLQDRLITTLETCLERQCLDDGVVAQNLDQAQSWWMMREGMSSAQKKEGASIKHDMAVPLAQLVAFMTAAQQLVYAVCPTARLCSFGHVGDGNIHYNITQPETMDQDAFLALRTELTPQIHALAESFGGTFSAEHGVGQIKRDELASFRGGAEYETMKGIKQQLDPRNILNPAALFRAS